jgi:hypothetical protein
MWPTVTGVRVIRVANLLFMVKEQIMKLFTVLDNIQEDHAANKTVINKFQTDNCDLFYFFFVRGPRS